jgi:predicted nuclease with TOPRIM domain
MLIKRNIRRILQNIPEKNTKDVLEEIILILEELDGEKTHLATKNDIKQVKDDIKDDVKHVIEMMNARFEAMEKNNAIRFESIEKRLSFMQWLIGGGVLLVALKLFFPHIFPH